MLNFFKKTQLVIVLAAAMTFWSGAAIAQHAHDHGAAPDMKHQSKGMSHGMSMANRPVQTATVNGLKIILDVMDMDMHVHMQSMKGFTLPDTFDQTKSQAIMIMIKKASASQKIIKDADVTLTITGPTGEKKTSKLTWYGDHYGESFKTELQGAYQLLVKVEGNGLKGAAKFKYTTGEKP
ncbi:MAG: hypothetical protein WCH07_04210 [Deltaproteobacteria bacterium]